MKDEQTEIVFDEERDGMKPYFFTFGGNCLGYYVVIYAKDYSFARAHMHRHFGSEWAFQYESAEKAGVFKYNLCELPSSPFYAE